MDGATLARQSTHHGIIERFQHVRQSSATFAQLDAEVTHLPRAPQPSAGERLSYSNRVTEPEYCPTRSPTLDRGSRPRSAQVRDQIAPLPWPTNPARRTTRADGGPLFRLYLEPQSGNLVVPPERAHIC